MTTQASSVQLAQSELTKTSHGCCGSSQKSGRMKWLMAAAAVLLAIGLVTGSAILGFAAVAPLLYVLPCLAMCGMCLLKQGGAAKS